MTAVVKSKICMFYKDISFHQFFTRKKSHIFFRCFIWLNASLGQKPHSGQILKSKAFRILTFYEKKKIKNRFADHPLLSGPITIVFIKNAVIHHSLFQKIKTELVYILTDYYQVMHSASDLFGKVKPTYLSVRHIL